jgi:ATP-dependent Clp protease ATP-binding subunit ClpC
MRDRLQEAARSAERLLQRYETSGAQASRASRELAGRLALQLLNLQRGLEDSRTGAPVDVLLRVTPALEGGGDSALAAGWCRTLSGMYRQWAARRRMRIEEIAAPEHRGTPILHVIGFGAFRTLGAEAGLHVLDDHRPENARRTVARVTVASGPDRDLPVAGKFTAASRLLAAASVTATIVRRYRGEPSPLVRDIAAGWRTGRLETVLDGDFDLMADVSRAPPAEKGARP